MIRFLPRFFSSSLGTIWCGPKKRHIPFFFAIIALNSLAALLEGASFGLLLASFSVVSSGRESVAKTMGVLGNCVEILLIKIPEGHEFLFLALFAVLAQVFRSAMVYFGQLLNLIITTKIQVDAQQRVYAQIFRFSFPYASHYKVGDLVEYAKSPSTILCVVMDSINGAFVMGLDCLACLIVMFCLSPTLALLSLLIFGFFGFFLRKIIQKLAHISCALTERLVEFSKHAVQSLAGLRVIHTFHRQANVLEKIESTLKQVSHLTQHIGTWNTAMTPINEILNVLIVGTFLILGQILMSQSYGSSTFPLILTFITIVYRFGTRQQNLVMYVGTIARMWGQVKRLNEILSDEGKEFTHCGGRVFRQPLQRIVFEKVSLKYSMASAVALKTVSLIIPRGHTVALVGASGAGKSSLIDLIVRLYNPTSGMIYINDQPLHEIEIGNWRKMLGVVSQDSFLFNESIEENIRFGRLDASLADIQKAAQFAGAHEFIMNLPHGYQSVIGERGYRLSGGEKQRISLARALVRDPEILILDEATCSLDSKSELLIQETLKKFHGQKTIIAVAHRLSTIVMADTIYVMEQGKIVESGAHTDLLHLNGYYANYWNIQSPNKAILNPA